MAGLEQSVNPTPHVSLDFGKKTQYSEKTREKPNTDTVRTLRYKQRSQTGFKLNTFLL